MLTIAAKTTSMNTESLMHGSQNHSVLKTPVTIFYFQRLAREARRIAVNSVKLR
jgi:hypothetical protein